MLKKNHMILPILKTDTLQSHTPFQNRKNEWMVKSDGKVGDVGGVVRIGEVEITLPVERKILHADLAIVS